MQASTRANLSVFATLFVLVATPTLVSGKTLIHAGRLIDGRSDTARTSVTIVVDADRIVSIADGFATPSTGDTVVDLKTSTVMPGLMDMHVHLTHQQQGTASYAEGFFLNPADIALRATTYAKKTLLAGFTTVRDCGAGDKLNLALRDAAAKGWIAEADPPWNR
jgi:imidazolonepropionase-like amidohydrolase